MSSQLNQNLEPSEAQEHSVFDRIFRDREGNIVIFQMPNLPLLVGVTGLILQFIIPAGKVHIGLDLITFGALFTWSWQEFFGGVNYFRRSLGLLGLVGLIALGISSNRADFLI